MNKLGLVEHRDALRSLARLEGAGMLLTGMTGTGKTAMLRRILELIAPTQVLDFAVSEACGWYGLKQCVYLVIDHASNGSRGGVLKRILQELGEKVDEQYFAEHEKTTNLDTLLVVVAKLLSRHRVALLVIDEHQQSTFEDSPWRMEFVLFYLTLMNLGISVVLSGNPLAFEHLKAYSQVMRRFSVGGVHRLQPAAGPTERWWERDFVPEARKFSIVDRWEIPEEARRRLEFEQSGGLPGLFAPYHVEVQRCCLRRGGTTAVVTEVDFAAAANSPHFVELKRISAELIAPSRDYSRQFLDIPPTDDRSPSSNQETVVPTSQTLSVVKRMLKSFTSAQTKKTNTLLQKLKSLESMHPDDIRALGITQEHLNHLEALASASAKKPGKRAKTLELGDEETA